MKKGFSLVEIIIVVALLGILATIVILNIQDQALLAKIAAAKNNLRILRSAIEYYAAQHEGSAPGYSEGNIVQEAALPLQLTRYTDKDGRITNDLSEEYPFGCYITKIPENSFNSKTSIKVIRDNESFPESATGNYGWVYKPATKNIRLDWPGKDKDGIDYFDY